MAYDSEQDPESTVTYKDDWTEALASMAATGLTISSATVTADNGAIVTSPSGSGTSVVWRMSTHNVTPVPAVVIVTETVTLSNGDVDVRHKHIKVRLT